MKQRWIAGIAVLFAALVLGGLAWRHDALREWQVVRWPGARLQAECEAHPEDALLQRQLARRQLEAGAVAEAAAAARAAVRAAPERAEGWVLYGDAARRAGREADAAMALRRAIQLDPRAAEAYLLLGSLYQRQQSSHGAIDQFRRYTQLRPRDPRGWHALALAFLELSEPGNATAAALRAAALRPADPSLQLTLGEGYRRQGNLAAAAAAFQAALPRRSGMQDARAAALLGLGQVALARSFQPGQLAAAVTQLREAVRLAPENATARYELGQALAQQGQLAAAVAEWQRALAAAPDEVRCHHALAQALAQLGRPREAAAHRRRAAEQRAYQQALDAALRDRQADEDPAAAQLRLARVHLSFRRRDRAIAALRATLDLAPDNEPARATLARLEATP